jgi:hypothetical protein
MYRRSVAIGLKLAANHGTCAVSLETWKDRPWTGTGCSWQHLSHVREMHPHSRQPAHWQRRQMLPWRYSSPIARSRGDVNRWVRVSALPVIAGGVVWKWRMRMYWTFNGKVLEVLRAEPLILFRVLISRCHPSSCIFRYRGNAHREHRVAPTSLSF